MNPNDRDTHIEPVRVKHWYEPLINPFGRYRALRRNAARAVIADAARHGSAAASYSSDQLQRAGEIYLRECHPADYSSRTFHVLVIMDRGYFSSDPPEALAELGPFRTHA
ncbi:hypothetical protein [Agromyces sp. Root81]|uniref:hypothetical protein n=1 Tax=Agromyces sp. Root81 TaxID=1736601 RepID=UPI0012FA59A1|nr:hypothetical protein [Agromyces sp. Root81]